MIINWKWSLTCLILAVSISIPSAWAQPKDTLVFGRVSSRPQKHFKRYPPLVDYVVKRMTDLGIKKGEIRLVPNNESLIAELKNGNLDWVTETVFSSLIYQQKAGSEIMLRRWKKGKAFYRSVMIARKDSKVSGFESLVGRRIAFEDPGSTTAYFVPAATLREAGYKLVHLRNPRETPPPGTIGYIFTDGEQNIATLVHKGLALAGAYALGDWTNPKDTPEAFKKDLRIFYESDPIPRCLESVRGDLDPRVKQRLKEILLGAHEDPEGIKALKRYHRTAKFDLLPEGQQGRLELYRKILDKHFGE